MDISFIYYSIASVLALLLSGNLYFIRQLVDKIQHTAQSQIDTKNHNTELFQKINGVSAQLREIKIDIKELRRLEIDVAVLKNQYNNNPIDNE